MKTKNMTTLHLAKSIGHLPWRRGYFLTPLALACFALLPMAQAVTPAPDGGYPGANTAEGNNALLSLTTGTDNTATGFLALQNNTTGNFNTADGSQALNTNTTGSFNTATGVNALQNNTTGQDNVATGLQALQFNTTGLHNVATGVNALIFNTTGGLNTATGGGAMEMNTTGIENAAHGYAALISNTTGNDNTADGHYALLNNTTGAGNIALGASAGANLTTGSNNIDIGNAGVAAEARKIHIGVQGTQNGTFIAGISGSTVGGGTTVVVNPAGKLGVAPSSARFKDEVKLMDKASEAILALKPVTFRYKKEIDTQGTPQFGLVAEDVEKVNPDLVARD